jgi:hypothetical protein
MEGGVGSSETEKAGTTISASFHILTNASLSDWHKQADSRAARTFHLIFWQCHRPCAHERNLHTHTAPYVPVLMHAEQYSMITHSWIGAHTSRLRTHKPCLYLVWCP